MSSIFSSSPCSPSVNTRSLSIASPSRGRPSSSPRRDRSSSLGRKYSMTCWSSSMTGRRTARSNRSLDAVAPGFTAVAALGRSGNLIIMYELAHASSSGKMSYVSTTLRCLRLASGCFISVASCARTSVNVFSMAIICAVSDASTTSARDSAACRLRTPWSFFCMYDVLRIHETSVGFALAALAPLTAPKILRGPRSSWSAGSMYAESATGLRAASLPSHTPSYSFRSMGMPISESRSMGRGALLASWVR